jgi:RNA polymerase sigma-70 factor (ECF subfamily)
MDLLARAREDLLVAKAQLGNEDAFEQLVRAYDAKLHYFVQKQLLKKDLADDVLQEVWAAAYRKLPRLRARQAFSVWIYRIAYSEAMKVVRTESQYVELPEWTEAELPSGDDGNEFAEEDVRLLNAALEKLKRPLREVLVLKFVEEMSYEEMSEATGVPVGTVRSRIHYAKSALRKEMEGLRNEEEQSI